MTVLVEFRVLVKIVLAGLVIGLLVGLAIACSARTDSESPAVPATAVETAESVVVTGGHPALTVPSSSMDQADP